MNELEANVEKYFRMLHPDFDQLESGEQWIASYDRDFLRENFYEIDSKFLRNSLAEIPGQKKQSPTEILKMVLAGVRSEKHFHILHPDYERMSDSEKWKALDDQMFLFNHDDEVNKEYYKLRGEARYVREEEPNPQECMRQAVENVKAREEQSKQENNQQLSTEENNQEQSTDDNDER